MSQVRILSPRPICNQSVASFRFCRDMQPPGCISHHSPIALNERSCSKHREPGCGVGQRLQGNITYPGFEPLGWEVLIERLESKSFMSWRWHRAAVDAKVDHSAEPTMVVVFELQDADGGTLLSVAESGLDAIPSARRLTGFRMNSNRWETQMKNIEKHVAA